MSLPESVFIVMDGDNEEFMGVYDSPDKAFEDYPALADTNGELLLKEVRMNSWHYIKTLKPIVQVVWE